MDIPRASSPQVNCLMDLGLLPVPGYLCDDYVQAINEPKVSNSLSICRETHLIQQSSETARDLLNKKVYSNYQSTYSNSSSLNNYMKNFIDFVLKKANVNTSENILEIGSNNGHVVKILGSMGFNSYGVDPSSPKKSGENFQLIPGFFGEDFIEEKKFKSKFKLIYSRHTLEHVYEPLEVMQSAAKSLSDNGKLIIEVPYAQHQIARNHFEGISIQHESFFTLSSLKYLADNSDLIIEDFIFVPMDGGSIISIFSKKNESKSLESYLEYEKNNGFYDGSAISFYDSTLKKQIDHFRDFIEKLSSKGSVCGYGGGSKGSNIFNILKLDNQIDLIFDDVQVSDVPKYLPGCGIKVVNPSHSKLIKPDYIIISAPTHIPEISRKINDLFQDTKIIVTSPYFGFLDKIL